MKRNHSQATCPYFLDRADYLGRAYIHCQRGWQGQALTFDSAEDRDAAYLKRCCSGSPCRLRDCTEDNGWIPIEDRQPSREDVYLCCYHFGNSEMRFLQVLRWFWDDGGRFQHEDPEKPNALKVTHWMPICKPEKKEGR